MNTQHPSDVKSGMGIFCKLSNVRHEVSTVKQLSSTQLSLSTDTKFGHKKHNFKFDGVFPSYAEERDVFKTTTVPLLANVLNGENSLLLLYELSSDKDPTSETKIPSRCVKLLFNSIRNNRAKQFLIKPNRLNGYMIQTDEEIYKDLLLEAEADSVKIKRPIVRHLHCDFDDNQIVVQPEKLYTIFVSCLEIYNNTVYDLLDDPYKGVARAKIIREDPNRNMYVNDVTELEVTSMSEVSEMFHLAEKSKRKVKTNLSHTVFTFRVVQFDPNVREIKVGQLNVVNLASPHKSNHTIRPKEVSGINNSLLSLRTCLEISRKNRTTNEHPKLIPYRDSRLTLLLKSFFEGDGLIRMLIRVDPAGDYEENLQALKFGRADQEVETMSCGHRPPKPKTNRKNFTQRTRTAIPDEVPSLKLDCDDPGLNSKIISDLTEVLQERKSKRQSIYKKRHERNGYFKERLHAFEKCGVLKQNELTSVKALLKRYCHRERRLRAKITRYRSVNIELERKNQKSEKIISSLEEITDEKRLKLNQAQMEKVKNKIKFDSYTEKLDKELDEKLREQREKLESQMKQKDEQLEKVLKVLGN